MLKRQFQKMELVYHKQWITLADTDHPPPTASLKAQHHRWLIINLKGFLFLCSILASMTIHERQIDKLSVWRLPKTSTTIETKEIQHLHNKEKIKLFVCKETLKTSSFDKVQATFIQFSVEIASPHGKDTFPCD